MPIHDLGADTYQNYIVFFSNEDEYQYALSLGSGNSVQITPADIAIIFGFTAGINYNFPIGFGFPDRGMYTLPGGGIPVYDNGFPAWPGPGLEVNNPQLSGAFLKSDVLSVLVPGTVTIGNAPYVDHNLIWVANFVFFPPIIPSTGNIAPVPKRRWITGFENPGGGEGVSSVQHYTRDASRTLDGLGWALRNDTGVNITRAIDQYRTGFTSHSSWERFYLRIRNFGAAKIDIWKTNSSPGAANGIRLYIQPDGSIQCYNVNSFLVETLLGVSSAGTLAINEWNKFDCIVQYNSLAVSGSGQFTLFLNANPIAVFDFSVVAASAGIGANSSFHTTTLLGTQVVVAANTWEIDIDDWINADVPNIGGVVTLNSNDFIVGTHIHRTFVDSGSVTNWTGQVEYMNQMIAPTSALAVTRLTSTTSGASMVGITNATDNQDATGIVLFTVSALIAKYGNRAGVTNGSLGYSLAGGAPVMAAITENGAAIYNSVAYLGTGLDILPLPITPFSIIYTKSATTDLSTVHALSSVIEYAGIWGPEDIGDPTIPRVSLTHNSWYPDIVEAFTGPVSNGLLASVGGIYIGAGTTQQISLPMPCHFLIIRPIGTGTTTDVKWFGSCLGGHLDSQEGTIAPDITRVQFDILTGLTTFTVTGENPNTNATGVTYQYIAFCDPAMQFNLCGVFSHSSTLGFASNDLVNLTFTPSAVFFNFELLTASANIRLSYKGLGHSGSDGTRVDGTDLTNLANLSTGLIQSGNDAHSSGQQTTYSAWRTGNNCGSVMVQILSYMGDGTGNRTITLTPQSTRFPLFAYIQPHNAVGYVKDPSDATTTSRKITDGAPITTAIRGGGVDTLSVGATLNANGIIYDVFVIPGNALSWSNGLFLGPSCNPTCILVTDPCTPPVIPPGINLFPNGGLEIGGIIPQTLLRDVSGIYTLVPGKTNDTLYDRQTGQVNVDVAIPDPQFKTGYIGG